MSVGWERAAARVQREARARQDRRERLRDGRRRASWEALQGEIAACARCGARAEDRLLAEDGEICTACYADAEIAAASAPATLGQRLLLVAVPLPGLGLGVVLLSAVWNPTWWWMGAKSMVAFLLLSLFTAGWGAYSALLGGAAVQRDLDQRQASLRTAVASVGALLGLAVLTSGLVALGALV
ncbi:MAG: hypothetical protein EP330_22100 [Deltaproteobacteria bacterium]|nr:MAG: hypothetical protein EP330_22100 [Deltaproteobacteria bacterium]